MVTCLQRHCWSDMSERRIPRHSHIQAYCITSQKGCSVECISFHKQYFTIDFCTSDPLGYIECRTDVTKAWVLGRPLFGTSRTRAIMLKSLIFPVSLTTSSSRSDHQTSPHNPFTASSFFSSCAGHCAILRLNVRFISFTTPLK